MAIDSNDRIFLAGYANMGAGCEDFVVACYNPDDDDWDDDFGGDGIVTLPIGGSADRAYAVAVDSEDRIVLAGRAYFGGGYAFALARLGGDGTLDTGFGGDGIVTTIVGNSGLRSDCAISLALDARGRIAVCGVANMATTGYDFVVARYLADGQLDPSFGGDGVITRDIGGGSDTAYGLAIDAAGRIVVAGEAYIGGVYHFAVARLNPDGTLTTSTTQYVPSPRYIDAVICRDTSDGATLQDGSRVYYLADANHNVTALVDAAGEVVERYTYTPYGEVTIYDGTWSETYATSIIDNSHLYTGRVYDGAIDLIYFRNRWYDAGGGGFVSRDPILYGAEDVNLYRYVGNGPLAAVDPDGLMEESPCDSCGAEYYWDLKATLDKVEAHLLAMPASLITAADPQTHVRWDISELFDSAPTAAGCVPSTQCCKRCVTIQGKLQDRYEVNYALFGFLMSMCNYSLAMAKTEAFVYKGVKGIAGAANGQPLEDCEYRFQYTDSVSKWIEAGYRYARYYAALSEPTPGFFRSVWKKRENGGQPMSLYMPQTDNPLFSAKCSPCPTEAHSPNRSSGFFLFVGLGHSYS